jgi:alpha-tubulin suppressor-like RCC1 family protein
LNKSWYSHYHVGAPSTGVYTKIYSNSGAFAALKADGSIKAWGGSRYGGTGAPDGSGYTKIYSTGGAFAVIETDGSITAWGYSFDGGMNTSRIWVTPHLD